MKPVRYGLFLTRTSAGSSRNNGHSETAPAILAKHVLALPPWHYRRSDAAVDYLALDANEHGLLTNGPH